LLPPNLSVCGLSLGVSGPLPRPVRVSRQAYRLGRYLSLVEKGHTILVTDRGKPVEFRDRLPAIGDKNCVALFYQAQIASQAVFQLAASDFSHVATSKVIVATLDSERQSTAC